LKPAFGLTFADLYRRDGLVRLDRVFIEALEPFLKPGHRTVGSINSPMQCMLKEVCGQCLQPHEDPLTREVSLVFSCFEQDQPLDHVDFAALHQRLGQNSLREKATALWVAANPVS